MWNRSRAKSSALERAMAHLQRRRGTRTELQERLGSPTAMTRVPETTRSLLQNLGDDISSDESTPEHQLLDRQRAQEEPGAGMRSARMSRFLKKASLPQRTSSSPSLEMIKTADGRSAGTGLGQQHSRSLALSRLAVIEDRIRSRRQAISGSGAGTGLPAAVDSAESSQSSAEPSMKGNRFLKKRNGPVIPQKDPKVAAASSYTAPQPKFPNKGVNLDSDEEDMKKLLGDYIHPDEILLDEGSHMPQDTSVLSQQGNSLYSIESASVVGSLSSSPSNITTTGKTMPSGPQLLRPSQSSAGVHSDVRSLDELLVDGLPSTDSICEKSILSDEFKINVMTLDDLAPDISGTSQTSEEKTRTTVNAFKETKSSSHNPEVVDANEEGELEPAEVDYESDFESEIKTETEHNVSDISELHGARSRDRTTNSEGQNSISERLQQCDLYSQSEREEETPRSEPNSIQSGTSKYSESPSSCSRGSYLRTASEAINPLEREHTPSESRDVRDTATQTQAYSLSYTCSTGMAALGPLGRMSYTDPIPVSSGIICNEAIEAFTHYNPAVLVLNDMLRQQLALTRQFVETSRHLHNSVLESLGPANYHYTTLQDTKEFIKSHKSPRLTMEEALQEVLQEMREYHYI